MSGFPQPGSPPGRERLAAALEQIAGVVAASLSLRDDYTAQQVWVAAAPGRDAAELEGAVRQTLHGFGVACADGAVRVGHVRAPARSGGNGLGGSGGDSTARAGGNGGETTGGFASWRPARPEASSSDEAAQTAGSAAAAAPTEAAAPAHAGDRLPPSEPPFEPPPPWRARFLVLRGVETRRARNQVRAQVELARLGEVFRGEATDVDSEVGRARATARATLAAAGQAADGVTMALEAVQITTLFGRRFVAVGVEAASDRRLTQLAAIIEVAHSVEHAAALATLRAVERWIAW